MIELRRPPGAFARVGHRGAPALAPENTLRSFAAAVEHGCDMLELDVVPLADGTLVLAHGLDLAHGPDVPTLDEGLAFIADLDGTVGVQVDVKVPGHEREVVDALRRHGLDGRAFASSVHRSTLRRLGELAPELPRSYTFPQERAGISDRGLLSPLAERGAILLRASLPLRLPRVLARTGATALTLHRWVCSRAVIERAHSLGAAVYGWTVDDPAVAKRFADWEIDGIITNDPRIFSLLET